MKKALLLGGFISLVTFLPLYFAEDIERWQANRRGFFIISCPGPGNESALRASGWAFVAFAATFTPALLLAAGRTRSDVFSKRAIQAR